MYACCVYCIADIFCTAKFHGTTIYIVGLLLKKMQVKFHGKQDFTKCKANWLVCTRNVCNRDLCQVVLDTLAECTHYEMHLSAAGTALASASGLSRVKD